MSIQEFYRTLQGASRVADVEAAIEAFEAAHYDEVRWLPVGRENNPGTIEVSADPGRSLVERLTNGIDAVLEAQHERHNGFPNCRTPKEAAIAWLNIPEGGLSEMTPMERRTLAQRVTIKLLPGDGREARIAEVRDLGIGLTPEQMPRTILSLNESNKLQKHYLAGVYGQGGSSTFAVSKYTLIASRYAHHPVVGFTVIRYLDLPPEEYKIGHYVYLTLNGVVPSVELPPEEFPAGTAVKHFGYDLTNYSSPLGPNSLYGLLNHILFDPIVPVWLDNPVNHQRRVIKGSRNALNGAVDEGDEDRRGPNLSHNVPMFYVALGEFGRVGIEYWVLERPTQANKRPTAAFVNPSKPIILTLHGQSHAEVSQILVRKNAELPYLTQRLISHVDCNSLAPSAKRALFVSNREDARRGVVYEMIQEELVKALKSDDELTRLNNEAREQGMRERDESAVQQMRSEVARLLRIQGIDISQAVGGEPTGPDVGPDRPTHPRVPRPQPQPIDLHEPPTYIRLLWKEDEDITFYPEQRRYIRIVTDANSNYHNPNNPAASRINLIVTNDGVLLCGSTSLQGGRMRAIFESVASAKVGDTGIIRVELTRPGLPVLSDERVFRIVETPPVRPGARRVTLPPFDVRAVEGPEDHRWTALGWPENPNIVASSAEMENGSLVIYYSTVFPKYANQQAALERRDPALAASFTERYKIWLAVHSLLLHQDQQAATPAAGQRREAEEDPELVEGRERQERCRIATLSVLFAAREVQLPAALVEAE